MGKENKDNSTKAKEKSSPSSSEEEEFKHRQPSMNYAWYDDEGKLDAMIEALHAELAKQQIPEEKQKL